MLLGGPRISRSRIAVRRLEGDFKSDCSSDTFTIPAPGLPSTGMADISKGAAGNAEDGLSGTRVKDS